MRKELSIKRMSREEMAFAVDLAANEGWNPGLHDGGAFYDTDPGGFFTGYLGTDPVGCISAVSYENVFGFIGLYIVAPGFRGQGYGIQLWNAAMERMANHNVGLDGVVERQQDYRKSGFKLAYSNIRFECLAARRTTMDDPRLVPLQQVPFRQVEEYDRECFPAARTRFLKAWINMPQADAVGYVESGSLRGYGVIRKCRQGYKIGPLFACNPDIAETLYLKLCSYAENDSPVYLDVPEVNRAALSLAGKYGMREVFRTARMYTGQEPEIALDRIFGVTTFELG